MVQTASNSHLLVCVALCGDEFDSLPVLDAGARIIDFGGDIEGYDEVAEMVLIEGDDMLHSLSNVPARDCLALAAAIHEVANHCAMVGGQRCALLARAVEIKLRKPLPIDVACAVNAIKHELILMLQELSCRKVL